MQDFDQDTTSRRTYDLEGGNKIHAERTNPYGFIRIHFDKGITHPSLTGDFTTYDEADKKIQNYISTKNKAVISVINSHEEMV